MKDFLLIPIGIAVMLAGIPLMRRIDRLIDSYGIFPDAEDERQSDPDDASED